MKKKLTKIFITQIIIFFIASSYVPIQIFESSYLRKHVTKPCEIEKILSRTCSYDNIIATNINKLVDARSDFKALKIIPKYANHLSKSLAGRGLASNILGDVFFIAFLMMILNFILFISKYWYKKIKTPHL